ncbi:ParB/RepB/Spo0J family partition protein [Streptomyces prunicolor]
MSAAGRRTSLASLARQKVDDVPGQSDLLLLSLPLDKLIPTRFNPRRRFGTDEELKEFGQKLAKKQLQPAVVVSRAAYLKLWPDEAERVGSVPYVIANGERRWRASQIVGRPTIDVVHNEDVAKSRADFLDAVQSENNDRENLDPVERAIGIETMVSELGGADQVAAYYDKSKGWVSQQRKLLKLTPELQDLVSVGEMPVRVARDIAGLRQADQAAAWQAEVEARAVAKAAPRAPRKPAPRPVPTLVQERAEPDPFTAVNQEPTDTGSPQEPDATPESRFTAVNQSEEPESSASVAQDSAPVPSPRHDDTDDNAAPGAQGNDGQPRRLPYDNAVDVVTHLHLKMEPAVFAQGARVWLKILRNQHPEAYSALLLELTEQEQEQPSA